MSVCVRTCVVRACARVIERVMCYHAGIHTLTKGGLQKTKLRVKSIWPHASLLELYTFLWKMWIITGNVCSAVS